MPPTVLESYGGPPGPGSEWLPAAFGSIAESEGAIAGREPAADELAAQLASGSRVAVVISGSPPPPLERAPLAVRVVRRARIAAAGLRLRYRLAAAERRLCAPGRHCRRLLLGDRNDGYEVGIGRTRIRRPVQAVLVLSAAEAPTLLERSLAAAGEAVGRRLEVVHCRVLAGGTLMAELAAAPGAGEGGQYGDGGWFLRFHDEAPASTAAVELLLASGLPAEVSDRLVSPVASGRDGGLAWSLEERAAGTHPGTLTAELWSECSALLSALAAVPAPGPEAAVPPGPSPTADARLLEPHLGERERQQLERIASEADRLLASVPRRWGHGDFHPGNLIVRGGRLSKVLDWDAASPRSLPGLDLLHLIATTDPVLRRLPHGGRCGGPLQELAVGPGGRDLRAWLEGEGVGAEPGTLRALVAAYWLGRVARDLRTFPDRSGREAWIELNVRRPVDALAAQLERG